MNRMMLVLGLVALLAIALLCFGPFGESDRDRAARPRLGGGADATAVAPTGDLGVAQQGGPPTERTPVDDAGSSPSTVDTLVVRTVDELGEPLGGVPIEVRCRRAATEWWNVEQRVTTDATTGEVRLDLGRFVAGDDADVWTVAVDTLTRDSDAGEMSVGFDLTAPPAAPIVFELERGGGVSVEVVGPDGALWGRSGMVTLCVAEQDAGRMMSMAARSRDGTVALPWMAPATRFTHVPLGVQLEASFTRRSLSVPTKIIAPGPTAPGDEARFMLVVAGDHPIVRVRLLGDDGQPLAHTSIEVAVEDSRASGGHASRLRDVTDEEGVVLIDLEPSWEGGRVQVAVRDADPITGRTVEPDAGAHGVLELDRLPIGLTDMGDLVLGGEGLLVAGRVVDPAGAPLIDAFVSVAPRRGGTSRRVAVDADGRFELRGPPSGERRRLNVTHETHAAHPVDFDEGTRDLVVTMEASGSVAGTVSLDPSVPWQDVTIALTPSTSARTAVPGRVLSGGFARIEPNGTFVASSLVAGVYTVAVRLRSGGAVHQVDDVVVAAGRETRDPRLNPIDLRGSVRAITLTFAGLDEGERHRGQVEYREAGTEPTFHASRLTLTGAPVRLISSFPSLDVDIDVPGYQSVELRGVSADQLVEFQKSVTVRLVLTGDGEPFAAPYGLSVVLAPREGVAPSVDIRAPVFDENREIVITPSGTGALRVAWVVMKSSTSSASLTSFDADPEQLVFVEEGIDEQRIEVRLSKTEAERLLREFEQMLSD